MKRRPAACDHFSPARPLLAESAGTFEALQALSRIPPPFSQGNMTSRVLIVEDEMLVAAELELLLEELGHHCVGIAADLEAAADFFDEAIDLALVDLNLRDGLTGPQIGAMLGARGVTVLFVTANPNMLGEGIAGTIGVITKPTDERTVKTAVDYALAVRRGAAASPPPFLRRFG